MFIHLLLHLFWIPAWQIYNLYCHTEHCRASVTMQQWCCPQYS